MSALTSSGPRSGGPNCFEDVDTVLEVCGRFVSGEYKAKVGLAERKEEERRCSEEQQLGRRGVARDRGMARV